MAKKVTPMKGADYFGGCKMVGTSPEKKDLKPETKVLNLEITFEEALKLHLAIGECLSKLNAYKRNSPADTRKVLGVAVHLDTSYITVHEFTPKRRRADRAHEVSKATGEDV